MSVNEPASTFPVLPDTFDLNELKGVFSDEEIAALAEGDDPVVVLPDPTAKPDPEPGSLQAQDAAAVQVAQDAAAAAQQTIAAQTPAEPAPVAVTIDETLAAISVDVPDTTAADAVIKEMDAKMIAIQDKYDAGEMTRADMNAEIKALVDAQADARATIQRATELITDANARNSANWATALDQFKAAGNEALFSPQHAPGFDAALRAYTGSAESAGKPFAEMIRTAAERYALHHTAQTGQTLVIHKTAPAPAPTPAPAPKPQRPDAPQLLGNLNGDGGLSVDDGTFAAIDRAGLTDVFAQEAMMEKMTPEQMDAYLRGTSG